ncbi:acyltransferase family protein [Winogradskyella sp.]|uniref:acyltransferase family protein n=1 Tax=Winogradskyella sp. TaxID=1883156 RepID=UPI003BAC47B7
MNKRLHYIDWLRVLAFMTLILFHCAVPFVGHYTWEINNEDTSPWITRIIWWTHQWRLPLLFFIAGVGVRFSLRRRSILAFFGERTLRLLLPLTFAIFFITPIQVYFEWLQKGRISSSFIEFYPQVYQIIPYPEGAFTWSHMWFVAYLFVFTIVLLPVFSLAKLKWPTRFKPLLNKIFSAPMANLIMASPFILYFYTLFVDWPEQGSLIDDWFVFISSMTFYVFGFFFSGINSFWQACLKYRRIYLFIALSLAVFLFSKYYWNWFENKPDQQNAHLYIYGFLNGIHIWVIILASIGYAMRYLNYSNKYLSYLNKAIYPFYILHQAVIVASGYYVLQLDLGIGVKLLILIILCLVSIWLLYHFIVKNTAITRVLFGMKWKKMK